MADEKACTRCGLIKPLSEYHKCKAKSDGLKTACKVCSLAYRREYCHKNRDRELAYKKKRYIEIREKNLAYAKEYRHKNRDRMLENLRKYYKENKEKELKRRKKYYFENLDKAAIDRMKRRCRLKNVLHIPYRRSEIFKRDKGFCHICGIKIRKGSYHLDHIVPISKGGSDTADNVKVACVKCNLSKNSKVIGQISLFEFNRQQQRSQEWQG